MPNDMTNNNETNDQEVSTMPESNLSHYGYDQAAFLTEVHSSLSELVSRWRRAVDECSTRIMTDGTHEQDWYTCLPHYWAPNLSTSYLGSPHSHDWLMAESGEHTLFVYVNRLDMHCVHKLSNNPAYAYVPRDMQEFPRPASAFDRVHITDNQEVENMPTGNYCARCEHVFTDGDTRKTVRIFTNQHQYRPQAEEVWCLPCYEGRVELCQHCDELYVGHTTWVRVYGRDRGWCNTCCMDESSVCDNCDCRVFNEETHEVRNSDTYWCDQCIHNRGYEWCNSCDSYYNANRHSCFGGGVYEWNYTPVFRLFGTGNTFYGIELEMQNPGTMERRSMVDAFESHFPGMGASSLFYAKDDGSIGREYGVEIVSHPASLEYWREQADTLAAALKTAHDAGARAWSQPDCGLHIHISRTAFQSVSHMVRFGMLIGRNRLGATAFAQRSSENYARFDYLRPRGKYDHHSIGVLNRATNGYGEKYDAVNFLHDNSVEVRIFRPSMAIGRIMADLEFMDGLRVMSSQLTAGDMINGGGSWSEVERFFERHAEEYPMAWRAFNRQRFNVAATLAGSVNAEVDA